MADSAHVQTKSPIPLASSRDITTTLVHNPTSDDIANYNTALDPSVVSGKDNKLDLAAVDLNNEPIPLWYSKYGTGLEEAEIFYKTVLYSNGKQVVITGDQPYVFDIGPTVDLPPLEDEPSLDDEWHKNVVTDLIPIDTVTVSGVSTPAISTMSMYNMIREAQYMLFPVSSRHICKTSDGALHAVVSYYIDGLSRIIYLKSINGGATWTSTIVDNDDGCDYVLPSITCDSADGIHITWSRWKYVIGWTYWLFCGTGDIPDGFTCVSDDSSDMAYQRLLCGGIGSYSADYGINAVHDHGYGLSGGSGPACTTGSNFYAQVPAAACGWHHSEVTTGDKGSSSIPPSKTIKLLRYNGFPPLIPVDVVIIFDTASLPAGFTRYSDLDGKFIYLTDSVGSSVGSLKHKHSFTVDLKGSSNCNNVEGYSSGSDISSCVHYHTGTYTDPNECDNSPPGYKVVLGKVALEQTTVPQHAVILCDSNGLIDVSLPFTCLSGDGQTLHDKYLIGGTSYAAVSGSLVHNHGDGVYTSETHVAEYNFYPIGVSVADWHYHVIDFSCQDAVNAYPSFAPYMYHTDTDFDISSMGNDIFYLHIDSSGNSDSLVNITEFYDGVYQSFECTCLCDSTDVVHFLWVSRGINTTPTNPRVCYKQMVNGVLGSIEYPTIDDVACIYPSFDIDSNGYIHCAWGVTSSTSPKIQYCKRESSWGSVEDVDTTQYCGFPSNVVVDSLFNVYLQYSRWSDDETKISDVYYNKRSVGVGWGTPVNLSPGKLTNTYNQFPGQTYIDNKGNVVFTFTGKGYGSHTTVYHPVYRYLDVSGSVIPNTGVDASDIFPDDDNEIIYPSVFWHTFPLVSSVYHNLPVAGMTFLYLYNVRGVDYDTADIKFYSSPNALVGDVGPSGFGGSGEGDFSPGGVGAESLLQFESFRVTVRGYIGKTSFINEFGGYIV